MHFAKRMDRFGEEIFAALNERRIALAASGKKLWNLSVGTPDFAPSEAVRDALRESAADPASWKYTLRDTPEMLGAVCAYYEKRYGVTVTPDEVCSCAGSQEGMGHLGLLLCDPGDTVLLPAPCYPAFLAGVNMAEAVPYFYPLSEENGYLPDPDGIPPEVAEKAKYMIVSLPSNPTGSVGTRENYERLIAFARRWDITLIHDNAYSDIVFDGREGGSFLAVDGAREVGAEFFSLSKSFNLTGARISFLIGRKDIVAGFRKLRTQYDFGMFLPVQRAAVEALKTPREVLRAQCARYQARRDALCDGLTAIGWPVRRSEGSMFVWAKIPGARQGSSMDFCMALMERSGVICTPGESFFDPRDEANALNGRTHVRFALVLPPEEIREAVAAISASGMV
ncbi:MAG: aminotransferase class I/II-fold pyridoxal phosphate-dependent enzyme [Clostridia bacterium]|nr:aminotransferase class I/II-fold pyridoxal phosphate-dependent enzyme [Clostridia bacterium]